MATHRTQNVEFVRLHSSAFLTDPDFIRLTAEQRGVYFTLLLYLYCNDGRCALDYATLARLCNCDNFKAVWRTLAHKFQTRNGVIHNRQVSAELKEARDRIESFREAGRRGAAKRWPEDGQPNGHPIGTVIGHPTGQAVAKETKQDEINRRTDEIETKRKTASLAREPSQTAPLATAVARNARSLGLMAGTAHPSFSSSTISPEPSTSLRSRSMAFHGKLLSLIQPRSQSDRTCFYNVTGWLLDGCRCGKFNDEIWDRVLGYAREARNGRRPAAVFLTLLKRELGYEP